MKTKILLISVLYNILLITADQALQNGHCNREKHSCDKSTEANEKRYLFYDVNPPEGFNLRRDVYMRFAIMLAEAKKHGRAQDFELVLPPWYNLYHWKSDVKSQPLSWGMFFDINSLKNYAPVVELNEVMNQSTYGLNIDTVYVLQNFENAFENGVFEDKWKIVGSCKYEGKFWGYENITAKKVICVQFQGSISKLWEIVDKYPEYKKIMFTHGEIPLHDTYGTKTYWDCRKSMVFNEKLILAANNYIEKLNKMYIAIHWRRQDFLYSNRGTSIKNTVTHIIDVIKNNSLSIADVFIASDGAYSELEKLMNELSIFGLTGHLYMPDTKYSEGQVAIIEQIICSKAAFFIGTQHSTFTYRIQEEREILRFESNTTFNTFCPDVGKCEKPAKWTIVD